MISDSLLASLRGMAVRLLTQDNRITSHPIFMVQERRRVYGLDETYAEGFTYVHRGNGVDFGPDLDPDEDPKWFRRVGYKDIWINTTPCFTLVGAERYIERHGHNLNQPRIYVESGYRNQEWIEAREFFMDMGRTAAAGDASRSRVAKLLSFLHSTPKRPKENA